MFTKKDTEELNNLANKVHLIALRTDFFKCPWNIYKIRSKALHIPLNRHSRKQYSPVTI